MYCDKCKLHYDDTFAFCSVCGNKLTKETPEAEVAVNMGANYTETGANYAQNGQTPEQAPIDYSGGNANYPEEDYYEDAAYNAMPDTSNENERFFSAEVIPPKKKKRLWLKILIPVLCVLVVLASVTVAFGRTIFFALAPELYVGKLFGDTLTKVTEEWNMAEKNILGFDFSLEENFAVDVTMDEKTSWNETDMEFSLANKPGSKEVLAKIDYKNDHVDFDGQAFWDNENIGAKFSGTDGEYLTVPSKNFGKELDASSKFVSDVIEDADDTLYETLSNMDLSYEFIIKTLCGKTDVYEAVKKHLSKNFVELLKNSNIGSRETAYHEFDGGDEKAKKITFTVSNTDAVNALINTLKDAEKDKKLTDKFGKDIFKEAADELDDISDDMDEIDIEFEIVEYKGVVVGVTYSLEDDDRTETYTLKSADKKNLLAKLIITSAEEGEYEYDEDDTEKYKREEEAVFTSNWITESDEITFETTSNYKYEGDDYNSERDSKASLVLDFKAEKWEYESSTKWDDGEKNEDKSDGKCSKKGGFTFSVDDDWKDVTSEHSMTLEEWQDWGFQEWAEENYDYYRDDFLDYVYEEIGDFYYEYDTFNDWYSEHNEAWDIPDSYFTNWLMEEGYDGSYSDMEYIYDCEDYEETEVKCHRKLNFTLKNKSDLKLDKADYNNILDWDEDEFEDLEKEMEKKIYKEED